MGESSGCVYLHPNQHMLWKLTFHSAKPMKKAWVTPMSWINNLEVIISELKVHLEEAEEKLAVFTKLTLCIGQDMDLTALLKLEEERERQQDMERQEFLKAWKEQEAWGYELRSMLDIITQLWKRSRSLVSQKTASPVPTPMLTHVVTTKVWSYVTTASLALSVCSVLSYPLCKVGIWYQCLSLFKVDQAFRWAKSSSRHLVWDRSVSEEEGELPRSKLKNTVFILGFI